MIPKRFIILVVFSLLALAPANYAHAQWVQTNGPYGGDICALAAVGSNVFASAYGVGVYRTADNGANWTQDGLMNNLVQAFAVIGTDLFAGTNDSGVYLTTNNGTSWSAVNNGLTNWNVQTLVMSGTNLFAGTYDSGVYLSTNNGASWNAVGLSNSNVQSLAVSGSNLFAGTISGVFLSTNNGGSWTEVVNGLRSANVNSLGVEGTNVFVAINDGGVFRSTDNGTSWTSANAGLVDSIAVFAFGVIGTKLVAGSWPYGNVFTSTDDGTSWTEANAGMPAGSYVKDFVVSGSNIFAGCYYSGGVFLSTDSGATWNVVNTGLINTDVIALTSFDSNIFAGTAYSGAFQTLDSGASWNYKGFVDSNTVSFGIIGTDLFVGTVGDYTGPAVFLTTDEGTSWSGAGNGLPRSTDPLAVNGTNLFAGAGDSGVYLSTDNGVSWSQESGGLPFNYAGYPQITSLAFSGTNLFAGTQNAGVFLSTNNGTAWTSASAGLGDNDVQALAACGTMIFAATLLDGVFRSTDSGISWTAVNNGIPTFPYVGAMTASGTIVFAGNQFGNIYFTTDSCASWVNANFPSGVFVCINSLLVADSSIYVGTLCGGVWRRVISEMIVPPECSSIEAIPSQAMAGDTVILQVKFGSNANSVNTDVLHASLRFNTDLLSPLSLMASTCNLRVDSTSLKLDGDTGVECYVYYSNPDSLAMDDSCATMELITRAMVTDSTSTLITLDSLNAGQGGVSPLSICTNVAEFDLIPGCGTLQLQQVLFGNPITIDGINPNPATSSFTVSFTNPGGSPIHYEIDDVLGRILTSGETSGNQLLLSARDLPEGVLLLRASSNGFVQTREFVVVK